MDTRKVPSPNNGGGSDSGGGSGSITRGGGDLASLAALAVQDLSALLAIATASKTTPNTAAAASFGATTATGAGSAADADDGGDGGGGGVPAGLAASLANNDPNTLLAALASQDPTSTLAAVALMIAQKNSNHLSNHHNQQQQAQQQQGVLPSTAPVSSLLPSIVPRAPPSPTVQQQPQQAAAAATNPTLSLQAQLLALIGAVSTAAPVGASSTSAHLPPPNAKPPPVVVRSSFPVISAAQPPQAFHHHHHHHQIQSCSSSPPTRAASSLVSSGAQKSSSCSNSNQLLAPFSLLQQDQQNFTLQQLQQHAQRLQQEQQHQQPIPQAAALTMLVTDIQRKEQKKNAKRAANRKSASTSRARKKALVQEMTHLNQRLKRQALILSLLPDLVIVIDPQDNVITFCSAQVQNVLRGHAVDDLVGTRLTDLLVPASKTKLLLLIKQLVASVQSKTSREPDNSNDQRKQDQPKTAAPIDLGEEDDAPTVDSCGAPAGDRIAATAEDSCSFPLSVVNVDSKTTTTASGGLLDENENSDKEPSSLTASVEIDHSDNSDKEASLPPPPPAAVLAPVHFDGSKAKKASRSNKGVAAKKKKQKKSSKKDPPSSDDSNSNSLSTVQKANANLGRNVRWHNKKMKSSQTANNATARLSSLQHRPESLSSEDDDDDSGYRESNDSREEETSSSSSSSSASSDDISDVGGRCKPLAPTCNVCLIRKDLTTIWCEVTSSIRTKQAGEDSAELFSHEFSALKSPPTTTTKPYISFSRKMEGKESSLPAPDSSTSQGSIELLLCLRPIRDGDKIVDRKVHARHDAKHRAPKVVSESSNVGPSSGEASENPPLPAVPKHRKKRGGRPANKTGLASKRRRKEAPPPPPPPAQPSEQSVADVDTKAVESLLLMNKVLK